jgi:polysaccharide chain length determinant protein (PEP-CTERM system associated)
MDQLRILFRRQMGAAWRYRWATIICAWLVCGLGWVGTTFIPNQFESSARLFVDADAVLTPLLRGLAVDNQVPAQLDVLQRTLLSRPNLEKLISNTDLDLQITGPGDLENMVADLGSSIRINPQTKNLFTITYRHTNPKLAFDVVQTILTTFIESRTGSNRAEMQNAQVFVEQQIAAYERQLREAEKRRADFRGKYVDLLPGEGGGTSGLAQAQVSVRQLQGQLQDEMMKRDMLKGELTSVPPLLVTEFDPPTEAATAAQAAQTARAVAAQQPKIQTVEDARVKEAESQIAELRLRYTEQHPDVVAARKRLDSLKVLATEANAKALAELNAARTMADAANDKADKDAKAAAAAAADKPGRPSQVRSRSVTNPIYEQMKVRLVDSEGNMASLQRRLADATSERDRLAEIARGAPGLQAEYLNLNRDYEVIRKNYDELLGRRESMRIATAAEADADKIKVQIVDPPQVPQNPVAPKRGLLISAVLLAGLLGGLALALLLAQFDQSFHTLDELRDFGLPVAGSISLIAVTSRTGRMVSAFSFAMALTLLVSVYGGLLLRLLKTTGF